MYLVLRSSFSGCDIVLSIRANPFCGVCSFGFFFLNQVNRFIVIIEDIFLKRKTTGGLK
jgi:hypothetical protein